MISVVAVGDISLGDHYFNMGHGTASFIHENGLRPLLRDVETIFKSGDIVFGNLETPLRSEWDSNSANFKELAFCGPARCARELAEVGFNVLNVANNHMLQYGEATFFETIHLLRENNIFPLGLIGAGEYYSDPYRTVCEGKTILFFGYSDIREAYRPDANLYAKFMRDRVYADIQTAKKNADLVFVSLHFGVEGIDLPSCDAKEIAQWLIESGVDMVFGHHPHVFQPVIEYQGGAIAYSMGDFIFDLFWERSYLDSAIVIAEYDENKTRSISLRPTTFSPELKVVPLSGRKAQRFMDELQLKSRLMNEYSKETLERYVVRELKKLSWIGAIKKMIYFFRVAYKGNRRAKKNFIVSKIPGLR